MIGLAMLTRNAASNAFFRKQREEDEAKRKADEQARRETVIPKAPEKQE